MIDVFHLPFTYGLPHFSLCGGCEVSTYKCDEIAFPVIEW